MPRTGETCQQTGTYSGTCGRGHTNTAEYQRGDTFTACSTCGGRDQSGQGAVDWRLVSPKK